MPDADPESELDAAVAAWRQRHQLREGDPVFLLMDLLRIHQKHWEERRRREPAGAPELPAKPAPVSTLNPALEGTDVRSGQELPAPGPTATPEALNRWIAALAVLIAASGGYALGRVWP